MRKKSCFIAAALLSGQVLQPVLANNENDRQDAYQFPPVANAQAHQQLPAYQYAPQTTARQPMYYGYPVNTNTIYHGAPAYYYPRSAQPMMMPYGYQPANNAMQNYQVQRAYPGMTPSQYPVTQNPPQAPANQVPVYRSPYNPNIAATPGPKPPPLPQPKKEVKPWGDTRYIWPDFYTDFTGDFWDEMINAPYKMGYMPGGWRFPSLSSPDPVTVGDAVANQVPPILDESANFINFAD